MLVCGCAWPLVFLRLYPLSGVCVCVCVCLALFLFCAAQIAKALKSFGISTERYFLFKGSLTVPPCTEDVTWYVLKDQLPISKSDLDYARKIQGDNTRPLQPWNNRVIFGIH